MDNFESLALDKIEFTKRLALDDDLAKCLINSDENFKDTTVNEISKYGLIGSQIFPYPKVMAKITETKSYITMRFKYKKLPSGNIYKASYVTFYCFCHEDIIDTPYMVLRYDYMLQQINRLINNTRGDGWLGKMIFESMDDVVMDNEGNYIGVAVTYRNTEFQ